MKHCMESIQAQFGIGQLALKQLAGVLIFGLMTTTAQASLIGTTAGCTAEFVPFPSGFISCSPATNTVIAGGDPEFIFATHATGSTISNIDQIGINLEASSISLVFLPVALSTSWFAGDAILLSGLNWGAGNPGYIESISLVSNVGISNFDITNLQYGADWVKIDLAGTFWSAGDSALIQITAAHDSVQVSLPGTFSLLIIGVLYIPLRRLLTKFG